MQLMKRKKYNEIFIENNISGNNKFFSSKGGSCMKKKMLRKAIPVMFFASLLVTGCQQTGSGVATDTAMKAAPVAEAKKEANVYKGKVVGKSNKAKTISISVGKGAAAKTMMVKFNDETKGIEHAVKGHAAIINFEVVGQDKIATEVKPKLAELPPGVAEVQPEYVASLVDQGDTSKYVLVDSRPSGRFHEGTVPTSINIPVPKITGEGAEAVLPADKNIEIIFYCGGPT
jgi:hypothetical protein